MSKDENYKKYIKMHKEIIIIRLNYLKNEVGFVKECELIGNCIAEMQLFYAKC